MPHSPSTTTLAPSRIGFGTGGNAGLMISGDAAAQRTVIADAIALGITYFDTAPDYGNGTAETNLGTALDALGAQPWITTKVEVRAENLPDIAGHIERSVAASLERLGRDRLDCVQIHNGPILGATPSEGSGYHTLGLDDYLRPGGAIEGLRRVIAAGFVQHAGFVCRGNDAAPVRRLLDTGLFSIINVSCSLLNPSAGAAGMGKATPDYGGVIDMAQTMGCKVAVFSPLAGGLLTNATNEGQHTHPLARRKDYAALEASGIMAHVRVLNAIARHNGLSLAEMAYRFVLGLSGTSTVIGGFSDHAQLADAVTAAQRGPLPPAVTGALEAHWSSAREIHIR